LRRARAGFAQTADLDPSLSFPLLLGLRFSSPFSVALELLAAVNIWVRHEVLFELLGSLLQQLFEQESVFVKVEFVWPMLAFGHAQRTKELGTVAIGFLAIMTSLLGVQDWHFPERFWFAMISC